MSRLTIVLGVAYLVLVCRAVVADEPYRPEAGKFPDSEQALAYRGEVVEGETYGDADDDTRYVVYSATKPFVAGAMWALIGDGLVDVSRRVVDFIPEFGSNGKDVVTIEQPALDGDDEG